MDMAPTIRGGIHNSGTLSLLRATISGNVTPSLGGGIATEGVLSIDSSTISDNAGQGGGGGIFVSAASVTITNSTISRNSTNNSGGGIYTLGFDIAISNSTLSDDLADAGASELAATTSAIAITNTLFNRNVNIYGNSLCTNTFGTFIDNGGNFDSTHSCGVDAAHSNIQLRLGALQNNGGPTQTIFPAADSPVIDANGCSRSPATDQRGVSRPQGLQCDSGAVEVQTIVANLDQHGLTGAWYNAATGGQGFLIEAYKDLNGAGKGYLALGWYTFDVSAAGGQRWYTLQGPANSGDASSAMTIYAATGGNFNALPKITATPVGSATLSFADCATGTLNFNFNDGRAGSIPLTRIDPNITCSPSGDNGNATQNYLLSGAWYDPNTSGQGFFFDVNPAINLMFAAWYTYAPNGAGIGGGASQRWYTIQDNAFAPGTTSKSGLAIYETTGGVFNSGKVSAGPPVGTATLTIASCTSMTLAYTFTGGTNAGQTGTVNLGRVVGAPAECTLR
jgi:hypothetical protein